MLNSTSMSYRKTIPSMRDFEKKIKMFIKISISYVLSPNLILWRIRKNNFPYISFTFDDGPDPKFTPEVLAALEKTNMKGTFFVLGKQAEKYPDIVRKISDLGHEIGNHGFSHLRMSKITRVGLKKDIEKSRLQIEKAGCSTVLFRPPFGVIKWKYLPFIYKLNVKLVMWSIDSRDFESDSSQEVVSRVLKEGVKGGDIILFHDSSKITVDAIELLGKYVKEKNLKSVTISELINLSEQYR